MLTVTWATCGDDGHWCSLEKLNLKSIKAKLGVYMIWHGGANPRVVRVGQGKIAERLEEHRNDGEVLTYTKSGPLFVTWASVPANQLDGAEAYLADKWNPLVGVRFPEVQPIAVNSPWD